MRVFRVRPTIHSTIQLTSITFRNFSSRRLNKHHNLFRVSSPSSLPLTQSSLARAYTPALSPSSSKGFDFNCTNLSIYCMNQSVNLFCIVERERERAGQCVLSLQHQEDGAYESQLSVLSPRARSLETRRWLRDLAPSLTRCWRGPGNVSVRCMYLPV